MATTGKYCKAYPLARFSEYPSWAAKAAAAQPGSLKYTPESRSIVESNRLIQDCQGRGIVAERLFGEKEILLENAFSYSKGAA